MESSALSRNFALAPGSPICVNGVPGSLVSAEIACKPRHDRNFIVEDHIALEHGDENIFIGTLEVFFTSSQAERVYALTSHEGAQVTLGRAAVWMKIKRRELTHLGVTIILVAEKTCRFVGEPNQLPPTPLPL